MIGISGESLAALFIVGFGGFFLGRFFWAVSKALAKPLAVAIPFLMAVGAFFLVNFLVPGGRSVIPFSIFLAVIAGLLIQQLLLVASIATLEYEVSRLKQQRGGEVTVLDSDFVPPPLPSGSTSRIIRP